MVKIKVYRAENVSSFNVKKNDFIYATVDNSIIQIGDRISKGLRVATPYSFIHEFNSPGLPGTEVFLSGKNKYVRSDENPLYTKGIIEKFMYKNDFVFRVKWKNGENNIYRESDIVSFEEHMKEVLEEVKERYPPGTQFKCLHNASGGPVNDVSEFRYEKDSCCIRWHGHKGGVGCVYDPDREEKFATIIESSKDYLKKWQIKVDDYWTKYPYLVEMRKRSGKDDSPFFKGAVSGWSGYINEDYCYSSSPWSGRSLISYEEFVKNFYQKPEQSKEDWDYILEEANKRFPIGCRFYAVLSDGKHSETVYTQSQKCKIYNTNDGEKWIVATANIRNTDGVWAKLVSQPTEDESFIEKKRRRSLKEWSVEQAFDKPVIATEYKKKKNKIIVI